MSAGKHNGCASSEIGYTQVKVTDFEAEEIVWNREILVCRELNKACDLFCEKGLWQHNITNALIKRLQNHEYSEYTNISQKF